MKNTMKGLAIGCLLMGVPALVTGAETIPNSFSSGDVVSSSSINSNFSFLADRSFGLIGTDIYYTDGNVGIGTTSPSGSLHIQESATTASASSWADSLIIENNSSEPGMSFLTDEGVTMHIEFKTQVGRAGYISAVGFVDNAKMNFGVGNTSDVLTLKSTGQVGIGTTSPSYPLEMASGAHVTTGGVWTNASSRGLKENIKKLKAEEAYEALRGLEAVTYNYKVDKSEEYVGFIAEDVPNIVAMNDRKSLSPMDMVGVLAKVVQEQDTQIASLTALVCTDHPTAGICQK